MTKVKTAPAVPQILLVDIPNEFDMVSKAEELRKLVKDPEYKIIFNDRHPDYWGSDPLIPQTKQHFEEMMHHLLKHKDISVDVESGGLSLVNPEIINCGYVFSSDEKSFYVPIRHNTDEWQIDPEWALPIWKQEIFDNKNMVLNFHNVPFDYNFILKDGIDMAWRFKEGMVVDTQIQEWLLDENQKDDPWYYFLQQGRPAERTKWRSGRNGHAIAAGKAGAKLLQGYSLKILAPKKFGIPMTKFDDLMEYVGFPNLPIHFAGKYARVDGIATQRLKTEGYPRIIEEKLDKALHKVEMPYTRTIANMQRRGMGVNLRAYERLEERVIEEKHKLTEELFAVTGPMKFSGKQLTALFHDKLGLPVLARTKKGAPQFNEEAFDLYEDFLEKAGDQYPEHILELPKKIIRIKKLEKVHGTYLKSIRENLDIDGRVHCSLFQTQTVTGRLSSGNPNLQNLPTQPVYKDELDKEQLITMRNKLGDVDLGRYFDFSVLFLDEDGEAIKHKEGWEEKCVKVIESWGFRDLYSEMEFTRENAEKYRKEYPLFGKVMAYTENGKLQEIDLCEDDWLYLVSDYSQMELRMMAHLSNATSMIEAYKEGIDVHLKTASDLNNLPLDKVTKDMRQGAKAVNFGLIYGKTDYGYAIDWYSHEPDFWVPSTWSPSGQEPAKKYLEMTRQFLRKFFDANPAVEEYMKAKQDQAGRNGYVRSITGRKRRLPGIFSESASERNRAKRQSVNSIDQGSSADYLKIAMNKMEDRSTDLEGDFPCYQLLTVHDEIINLVRKKDAERCKPIMVELMTTAVPLRCPIETDPTVAYKYGSAK